MSSIILNEYHGLNCDPFEYLNFPTKILTLFEKLMAQGNLPQNSADSLYQISPDSVLMLKPSLGKGWFRVEYPFVEGSIMLSLSGVNQTFVPISTLTCLLNNINRQTNT